MQGLGIGKCFITNYYQYINSQLTLEKECYIQNREQEKSKKKERIKNYKSAS
jgi:hypothetical protein